jgi:hypothetical protein
LIRGELVDDLVVSGEHTTPNSDEYRRACSHSVYGELIRRSIPLRRRFYHIHRRRYSPAYLTLQTPRAIGSPRAFLFGKRGLHRFRNAAADRFTRRFYPPPLWKVNAAVMFWKAAKRERCESGDEHFGVGPYRAVWGSSCRLAKLSRNCEYSGQRGLYRVAGQHATSPRQMFDLNVESYDLHRA